MLKSLKKNLKKHIQNTLVVLSNCCYFSKKGWDPLIPKLIILKYSTNIIYASFKIPRFLENLNGKTAHKSHQAPPRASAERRDDEWKTSSDCLLSLPKKKGYESSFAIKEAEFLWNSRVGYYPTKGHSD